MTDDLDPRALEDRLAPLLRDLGADAHGLGRDGRLLGERARALREDRRLVVRVHVAHGIVPRRRDRGLLRGARPEHARAHAMHATERVREAAVARLVRRRRDHVDQARARLDARDLLDRLAKRVRALAPIRLRARRRVEPERGEVAAERPLAQRSPARGDGRERRARSHRVRARRELVDVAAAHVGEALGVERAEVLEHAERDVGLVEVAAIDVVRRGPHRERVRDLVAVRGALIGQHHRAVTGRRDHEAHAIAAREVARRDRGDLVDREIERRAPGRPGPQIDLRVEHEPDHVALLALEVAHQEHTAFGAGFPGDPAERIARLVLAQLAQIAPLAARPARPARGRGEVAATAARLHQVRREGPRQHLDAVRVREGERHLEEPGGAVHLEREAVEAVLAHARRLDLDLDLEPARRRDLALLGLDRDVEVARRDRAELDVARGERVAVADLGLDLDLAAARGAEHAARAAPQHLEARRADARDGHERDRARERHRDEQGPAPPHDRGLARGDPDARQRDAGEREMSCDACGVELHRRCLRVPESSLASEPKHQTGFAWRRYATRCSASSIT